MQETVPPSGYFHMGMSVFQHVRLLEQMLCEIIEKLQDLESCRIRVISGEYPWWTVILPFRRQARQRMTNTAVVFHDKCAWVDYVQCLIHFVGLSAYSFVVPVRVYDRFGAFAEHACSCELHEVRHEAHVED